MGCQPKPEAAPGRPMRQKPGTRQSGPPIRQMEAPTIACSAPAKQMDSRCNPGPTPLNWAGATSGPADYPAAPERTPWRQTDRPGRRAGPPGPAVHQRGVLSDQVMTTLGRPIPQEPGGNLVWPMTRPQKVAGIWRHPSLPVTPLNGAEFQERQAAIPPAICRSHGIRWAGAYAKPANTLP